ncbi:MAG: preprotein translocase subunit SecA [Brachymonas sp.]|jgi:preprotein translocase subunit SecA
MASSNILTKLFGSRNERMLKNYRKTVDSINALEGQIQALSDEQLQLKTSEFKGRIDQGESLDALLPEVFAVVREAAKRVMGMRHFDVQMVGGIALHQGKIAEMRTGEGKTLTSTLPVYLNAIAGKGVHVVTVNNYLAARDAEWMGRLYRFLGLTVGVNLPDMPQADKQAAYNCDITYGTNTEFGFDYLRDNMVYEAGHRVQRGLNYAIIDEVDSILIDEARTPLIISGTTEDDVTVYPRIQALVKYLELQEGEASPVTGEGVTKPGDYTVDEKARSVHVTDRGHEKIEQLLHDAGLLDEGKSLYSGGNIMLVHHVTAALKAKHLYLRDQQYVIDPEGKVVIVDEFTGRLMPGRRWSEGLMQAIEAKEGVDIQPENMTMGTITFQNYFRLFGKLAGMTGTADTEAYEFQEIYGLETLVIPPNRPTQRDDQQDRIYKTSTERYKAAIADIKACHEKGQPVLVGTSSIENSELISTLLQQEGLPHEVLNAKQHDREADIIAQAGRENAITIATNMAGRGTDIVLGGNIEKHIEAIEHDEALTASIQQARIATVKEEWQAANQRVKELGGLRVIATERHESRRIDNQLRGRSGRQGDPGSSRFYLSLEDPLMRIFAGDLVKRVMDRLSMPEGEAIEAPMVTRSIESAQRKVEGHHFDSRKQLLEYDDVANEQRKAIYEQRNAILDLANLDEQIASLREGALHDVVRQFVPQDSVEEQWDIPALESTLMQEWALEVAIQAALDKASSMDDEDLEALVQKTASRLYNKKVEPVAGPQFIYFQRMVLLQAVDTHWREHLTALDHLRQGIHLRSYAQKQPKQEYKREAYEMFGRMLGRVRTEVTQTLLSFEIRSNSEMEEVAHEMEDRGEHISNVTLTAPDEGGQNAQQSQQRDGLFGGGGATAGAVAGAAASSANAFAHVGRNDACPCGSGQKFKNCHGKLN